MFQVHGAAADGSVLFRRKLSRPQFARFIADQPPFLVAMEACASAHHWAREMARHGHEVRLTAPHYVKPFLKRQKYDAADAEAITEALRPAMRFVEPKSADQQARAVAFRTRERLVKQRTEAVNALRSHLDEFGHTTSEGIGHVPRLAKVFDDPENDVPELARDICRPFRLLNVLDDFNREDLGSAIDFSLPAERVVRALNQIIEWRGAPRTIRIDNGPEYISGTLMEWAEHKGIALAHIQPGKPQQNAYVERYNRTIRHEWLDLDIFETIKAV